MSFSQHLASGQKLTALRDSLKKPQLSAKERRIIQQLLPNLSNTVQIMLNYTTDGSLTIRTDNAGVASRIRFIAPQLKAQLGLKPEQFVKIICRSTEGPTKPVYWHAQCGSIESGEVLMSAASSIDGSSNVDLANALRRLAATIARD